MERTIFFKMKSYKCKKKEKGDTMMKKKSRIYIIWLMNLCLITTVVAFLVWYESVPDVSPEKVLKTYMAHISNREYEQIMK